MTGARGARQKKNDMQGIINGVTAFVLLFAAVMAPIAGFMLMSSGDDSAEKAYGWFLVIGWVSGMALWGLVSMARAGLLPLF